MVAETIVTTTSNSKSTIANGGNEIVSQSDTEIIDTGIFTYKIPQKVRNNVCNKLHQNSQWKEVATKMGYGIDDIAKIDVVAGNKCISPAELLLSLWDDQNHTVTELFMVLFSIRQFEAMEFLTDFVDKKYHRLLNFVAPNLPKTLRGNQKLTSNKILNGPPEISRDTNDSDIYTDTMQTSSMNGLIHNLNEEAFTIPQVAYSVLEEATNKWSDDNKLGSGGFGIVYKGKWKHTDVAIKKIVYRGSSSDSKGKLQIQIKQSLNELRHLNSCRHDNVVALFGYCIDDAGQCLVYQYMSGGSLESRLHVKTSSQKSPLTFEQRIKIALGTARGLQYIHTYHEKPLIHGDIKPANILLDAYDTPKIGDFGLVRFGEIEPMEVSSVFGTKPYLPIEFLQHHQLSTKIDTYSYGIVLFELFTGLRAYDRQRQQNNAMLATYMRSMSQDQMQQTTLIYKILNPAQVCIKSYMFLMDIAYRCTEVDYKKRPLMTEVLGNLDDLFEKIMDKYPSTS